MRKAVRSLALRLWPLLMLLAGPCGKGTDSMGY